MEAKKREYLAQPRNEISCAALAPLKITDHKIANKTYEQYYC